MFEGTVRKGIVCAMRRIGERRVRLEGRAALSLEPGEWRALPVADEP